MVILSIAAQNLHLHLNPLHMGIYMPNIHSTVCSRYNFFIGIHECKGNIHPVAAGAYTSQGFFLHITNQLELLRLVDRVAHCIDLDLTFSLVHTCTW